MHLQYKWRKLIPKPYTQLPKIQLKTFSSRILYLENQLSFQITALRGLWIDPLVGGQHWFHAYIAKYMVQFTAMHTFALQLRYTVQNITNKNFQYVRCTKHMVFLSFFCFLFIPCSPLTKKHKGTIHSARVWHKCGHSISVYDILAKSLGMYTSAF